MEDLTSLLWESRTLVVQHLKQLIMNEGYTITSVAKKMNIQFDVLKDFFYSRLNSSEVFFVIYHRVIALTILRDSSLEDQVAWLTQPLPEIEPDGLLEVTEQLHLADASTLQLTMSPQDSFIQLSILSLGLDPSVKIKLSLEELESLKRLIEDCLEQCQPNN